MVQQDKENVMVHGIYHGTPDKNHGAKMGPTWVLPASDGPHVGPMSLIIRDAIYCKANVILQHIYLTYAFPCVTT